MADVWSYLYNPSAASSSGTTGGASASAMPDWYVNYTQNLLAQAQSAAEEPFQVYNGQRVAELQPLQQQAIDKTVANQGSWNPALTQGQALTTQGATTNTLNGVPTFGTGINAYMNPYTQNVTDTLARLGTRNLTENLLPAVNSTFVGAGQFGSGRNAEFTNRALRDVGESTLNAQSQALNTGYQQAAQNMLGDQQMRIGAAAADAGRNLQGGAQLGALGQLRQQLSATDTGALSAAGQQQQNQLQSNLSTAYNDFLEQRNYPMNAVSFMNSALNGVPTGASQLFSNTEASTKVPASTTSPLASMVQAGGSAGILSKLLSGS
jgi:hypothetical protein